MDEQEVDLVDAAWVKLAKDDRDQLMRLGNQMTTIIEVYRVGLRENGNKHKPAMDYLFGQFGTCQGNRGVVTRAVLAWRKLATPPKKSVHTKERAVSENRTVSQRS